ncbi:MAG: RNA 2',3'-cyclic phosphodiesterase [Bacillota bacterium]
MRVFIALEMPDAAAEVLRPCLAQLEREIGGVKWVAAHNLHLTLKFLGEVSQEQFDGLNSMLASIARRTTPFVLTYGQAGFFRSGGEPSVIWLGVAPHQELQLLATQVASGAERLIPTPDRKPFRPHITLGRVRQPYRGPSLEIVSERVGALALPAWPAQELCVIKSELTPQGPIYSILSRHRLGGE